MVTQWHHWTPLSTKLWILYKSVYHFCLQAKHQRYFKLNSSQPEKGKEQAKKFTWTEHQHWEPKTLVLVRQDEMM